MQGPRYKPTVDLVNPDGNGFAIICEVTCALTAAGADREYCYKYQRKVAQKDYDDVLNISRKYVIEESQY